MEKFEYRILNIVMEKSQKFMRPYKMPASVQNELSELGLEGWEVVGICPLAVGYGLVVGMEIILKRKIR